MAPEPIRALAGFLRSLSSPGARLVRQTIRRARRRPEAEGAAARFAAELDRRLGVLALEEPGPHPWLGLGSGPPRAIHRGDGRG
jgi:hypothetical protein